jgi:hypothetical protein
MPALLQFFIPAEMSVRIIKGDVRDRKKPGPAPGTPRPYYKRSRATPLKDYLLCRKCAFGWPRIDIRQAQSCPSCGAVIDARIRRGTTRNIQALTDWRKANPDLARKNATASRHLLRRAALLFIGGGELKCVRCGCDKYEALEINHKNGGGRAELLKLKGKFYRDIAKRERDILDLEICCRVCNSLDYLERKLGPLPFSIQWGGKWQ